MLCDTLTALRTRLMLPALSLFNVYYAMPCGVIHNLQVRAKHGLHEADMPDADVLRANLQSFDFASFPILTPAALRQLRHVVDVDIHQVFVGCCCYCC